MKITRLGPTQPILNSSTLGSGGGTLVGGTAGYVPTANGSNGWAWAENVARITSNGSNTVTGPYVNFASGFNVTFAVASNTLTINSAAAAGSGLPWFDVTDYGAIGDGTTDDTTAVNAAIAAWNTATKGILYFPAGTYKVTAALTTITASGTVLGDGMGAYDGSAFVSAVLQTSQTATLFTITSKTVQFRDIGLFNTYVGNPSAGAGIQVSGSFIGQKVDLESVVLSHFYVNIDRQVGSQWTNHNVWNWGPVLYGEKIQNTVNQDAGDWTITDCFYYADTHNGTSAIQQVGAGGGKIVNTKINGHGGATFTNGITIAIPNGVATSVGTIVGCSIENVSGDAIQISTTGTGTFGLLTVNGTEVGLYSNNTGKAVAITAATAGGFTVAGGISAVIIDGCVFRTDGTARAAITLAKTDNIVLGDIALEGFNARYTSSLDTNTHDNGSSASFATPAIVLGTAAAAGAATTVIRSDSTIVAFDATVPTTQAFSDAAATGSAAVAARRDHLHGMPASPSSGGVTDHEHIVNVVFSGDASATVWELPAAPVSDSSIAVYVAGSRSIAWGLSGTLLTTLTFDSAPASATDNIVIDIVAATA